jgi:hypothetical protein
MTIKDRLLFYLLRLMDEVFPGWTRPKPEPADYLSDESWAFWITREGRR